MTISTPPIDAPVRRRSRAGLTLVEVMVAASLSTLVLAGVMSAFLFIGRTSYNASGYSEMSAQTRRALDAFANDARMASGIQWNNSQSITFIVPGAGSSTALITYAYDRSTTGLTAGCFYRLPGGPDSTAERRILVRNVAAGFAFRRYKLEQNGVTDHSAANDLETKLIQVDLQATRSRTTTVAATQTAFSARYLLRNKRVSN